MSVGEFQRRLHGAKYAQNDLKCFPLWVRWYAESVTPENGQLPVSVELIKELSRSLQQSGTPAWVSRGRTSGFGIQPQRLFYRGHLPSPTSQVTAAD